MGIARYCDCHRLLRNLRNDDKITGDIKISKTGKNTNTIEISRTIQGLEKNKIIIKPMEYRELLISLERLIRFQYPFRKRERIYKEIITKHTVQPKISLKSYYDYSAGTINSLVQAIWNTSLNLLGENTEPDYSINKYLAFEEIRTFSSNLLIKDILTADNMKYSGPANLPDLMAQLNSCHCGQPKKAGQSNNPAILKRVQDDESKILNIFRENGVSISEENLHLEGFGSLDKIYLLYSLNSPLNIDGLLKLIEKNEVELPVNLRRLIYLNGLCKSRDFKKENTLELLNSVFEKAVEYRENQSAGFPVNLAVLVEGATEEILLPLFAAKAGVDFAKKGVQLIPSGGKNQVARLYKKFYQQFKVPILIIMDSDAAPIAEELKEILRDQDEIFLIKEGEFEDTLPVDLICRSINAFYRMETHIQQGEICTDPSMVSSLDNLWKEKGLGEFDKVKFAKIIAENVRDKGDLSDTLSQIVKIISDFVMG